MEFSLIEAITRRTAQAREDVVLGVGDDAALLDVPAGQQLAAAVDTLVEGVHFPKGTAPADIGYKALAVNLSDLAAMGAMPAWSLLALTLPAPDADFVEGFAQGFAQAAAPYRMALVGGDTTSGPLCVSVTVHGLVPQGAALRRDGARQGDVVMVTGTLGDAAGGLACLDRSHPRAAALMEAPEALRAALLTRLNRPEPRVAAGLQLREVATACIDVSDGLLADLAHITAASGVGAHIDAAALPLSSALLTLFPEQATALALGGGDDYELCFTVPADAAAQVSADLARLGCGATRIGRIVAGEGVRAFDAEGQDVTPPRRGWEHFGA
ncbi:thiamine-phosphate kinase [Oleiagrimonas sp. C23AA]|uniref:thiamine-phosphate kinase n=1 Tax=Oleiagrimonas sp. C23AA TaxID=2719047 RepID=UPI001423A652|nr:thiamine-phosphate kinase [Oleiagrimonas sp. C23AA]NII12051.1 thiamine-phosphate kinase [Oleiagrimonas sp. C23AA]